MQGSRSLAMLDVVAGAFSIGLAGMFMGCLSAPTDSTESEAAADDDVAGTIDDGTEAAPLTAPAPPASPGPETCVTIRRSGPGDVTDAYLAGDHDSYETGAETQMWTGLSTGGNLNRVVMGFDLSPLPSPADATVNHATVAVYNTWSPSASQVDVHRATASWDELTVNRESFGDAIDPIVLGSFTAGGGEGFRSVDITSLVQAWHAGTQPNQGIVLEEPPVHKNHFWSSEVGNVAKRPYLYVCYNAATCTDGVQNQGEQGVDCGGPCASCETCTDGIQNQGEQGVDCGGPCAACATSCQAIKQASPLAASGTYTIDPDGAGGTAPYQAYCDMTTEGGGWTRWLTLTTPAAFTGLQGVLNSQEFVDNGTFQFSKTLLASSNREVLILETVAPFRLHRYDFKMGSNPGGESFVGALTGDLGANVGVFNWTTSTWQLTNNGQCNNNNHSQWNCEPETGVRFHYGTRDWSGNGGGYANTGWGGFTGYAIYGVSGHPGQLVKSWNGSFNKTPHDFFVR